MRKLMQDVAEFHRKFGCPISALPGPIPEDEAKLRADLVYEEAEELTDAIVAQDLKGIADGAADLIYVAIGAALAFGIDLQPVWDEVQKTNIAKDGSMREDRKIMKGPNWQPPDIAGILEKQKLAMIPLLERIKE